MFVSGLKNLSGSFRRWLADARANVAVITALSLIPVATITGLAIDFQSYEGQRIKIQYAADATALSASRMRQAQSNVDYIRTESQKFLSESLKANKLSAVCEPATISFPDGTEDTVVTVTCRQSAIFGGLVGQDEYKFTIESTATYGIGLLDVVFVFDSSGSMAGDKLTELKDAAQVAVDQILPADPAIRNRGDVRIGMVAYNHMVNAGDLFEDVVEKTTYSTTSYGNGRWISNPDWDVEYCNNSRKKKKKWEYYCYPITTVEVPLGHTCLYERGGVAAFDDRLPAANRWLTAGDQGDDDCPPSEPLPLTTNPGKLTSYINALTAKGGTAGHQGVAWGWYLLSPDWAPLYATDSKPRAYDTPDYTKVMIMMTDGEFNSEYHSGQGDSTEQAEDLCDAAKAKGIIIYTVAFRAPEEGKEVLNYCASRQDFAFTPENGQELEEAYRNIAGSISDLRIKR